MKQTPFDPSLRIISSFSVFFRIGNDFVNVEIFWKYI